MEHGVYVMRPGATHQPVECCKHLSRIIFVLYDEAFPGKNGDGPLTFHAPKMTLFFFKKENLLACRGKLASILQEAYKALLKRVPIPAWKNNACVTPRLQKSSDIMNRSTDIQHVFENVKRKYKIEA